MRRKLHWRDWHPGIDNEHRTLRVVLESMPAAEADDIPWQIRLFENPASWIAFPGAITLARHDALHAVLGRGLTAQDEAFVIGFTMGAASNIRAWQWRLFRFIARYFYPRVYRFGDDDLIAFDLGFTQGQRGVAKDVHALAFETMLDQTLEQIRDAMGINIHALQASYRVESIALPHTSASRRLDRDIDGVDPSDIHIPDAADSDWEKSSKDQ